MNGQFLQLAFSFQSQSSRIALTDGFLLFFNAPIAFKADAVGDVAILGNEPLVVAAIA
jgi:hypothetical protein